MFGRCRNIVLFISLFLVGACTQEERIQVNIFYTADVQGFYYSRLEPRLSNQPAGGYGILKAFLAKQEAPFLLFDGGNWFGGSPESTISQGMFIQPFLQSLPFTASSVSDKDFAFGWPALRAIVRELDYPILVSNLKLETQIPWPLHDYKIVTHRGIKIGIFGLVSPDTIRLNRNRLTGMTVQDPVQTATDMVEMLQSKGADFIILLSSLGDNTADMPADVLLAEDVPGIDLILSANKDRELPEIEQVHQTRIVYPGSKLDNLSHIRVDFDKNNRAREFAFENIPLLQNKIGEDEDLTLLAQQVQQETQKKLAVRVSSADERIISSLTHESMLGDLLADCLHKWAKLDGVILNSDSIRSTLPQGEITEYDLYKMYPYRDNITFLTMKGAAFLKALEASLESKDNFPQIAGFTVEYDPQAAAGNKIKKVTLANGRIVRPQDTYRFAVTDHVLAGGFGHDYFIDSLEFKNTFVEARQMMRACLIRQKKISLPSLGRWKSVL